MQSKSANHCPTPVWLRQRNASRGKSGADAKRLSLNIAASDTSAATMSPALDNGEATTDVSDVAAIATQIRATRAAGTPEPAAPRDPLGRIKKAPNTRPKAARAVATNAARQLPNSTNNPPTSGPIITDTRQLV